MEKKNCEGKCCCNCKHQLKLYSHPLNSGFGKGSIMEQCGFACLNPEVCEGKSAIFFDKEHGMCECWTPRNDQQNNVSPSDLKELLKLIDWMADWINEVGKRDFCNATNHVKEKTAAIRMKYKTTPQNNPALSGAK